MLLARPGDSSGVYGVPLSQAIAEGALLQSYGVVGNGVVDDTANMQACLTASAGKRRVVVRGDMAVSVSGLTLPSNISLVLDGKIVLRGGSNKTVLDILAGATNISIEGGGVVDGNRSAQTAGFSVGIGAAQASQISIRDVTVQNCRNMPVNIVSSHDCQVTNVTANACGNSFEFAAGSERCWAINCRISNIDDFGFAFYGRTHKSGIIGCTITGCSSEAITVLTDADQGGGCTDILISKNVMYANKGGAVSIVVNSGTGIHSGILVEGNRGYNNLQIATSNYIGAGVLLTNGANVMIDGNSFGPDGAGGNTSGIYVQGNAGKVSYATIQNNVIIDQGVGGSGDSIGIFCDGADKFTTIRGNSVIDTRATPLMSSGFRGVAGVGCLIENNLVRGPTAISVMDIATNNAVLRNHGLGWLFDAAMAVLGDLAVNGRITSNGSGFVASQPGSSLELGSIATASTPYIDFHSSGTVRDYDCRIVAAGGLSTADGKGSLNFRAGAHQFDTGIGIWGHAAPASQPVTPATLADVIAIIRAYGMSA